MIMYKDDLAAALTRIEVLEMENRELKMMNDPGQFKDPLYARLAADKNWVQDGSSEEPDFETKIGKRDVCFRTWKSGKIVININNTTVIKQREPDKDLVALKVTIAKIAENRLMKKHLNLIKKVAETPID
jgi:hypothetical protein